MFVRCKDKGAETYLTVGKVYEVLEVLESIGDTTKQDYLLVGDNSIKDRFITELFEKVRPMMMYWTENELHAIVDLACRMDLSREKVVQQALRSFQLLRTSQLHNTVFKREPTDAEQMVRKLVDALKVFTLTPEIRTYLEDNDPQALKQALDAIGVA